MVLITTKFKLKRFVKEGLSVVRLFMQSILLSGPRMLSATASVIALMRLIRMTQHDTQEGGWNQTYDSLSTTSRLGSDLLDSEEDRDVRDNH